MVKPNRPPQSSPPAPAEPPVQAPPRELPTNAEQAAAVFSRRGGGKIIDRVPTRQEFEDGVKKLLEQIGPGDQGAIDELIAAAGILFVHFKLDQPTPPPPAAAEKKKFRLRRPGVISGHCYGLVIRNGVGETDDAAIANAARAAGCVDCE